MNIYSSSSPPNPWGMWPGTPPLNGYYPIPPPNTALDEKMQRFYQKALRKQWAKEEEEKKKKEGDNKNTPPPTMLSRTEAFFWLLALSPWVGMLQWYGFKYFVHTVKATQM